MNFALVNPVCCRVIGGKKLSFTSRTDDVWSDNDFLAVISFLPHRIEKTQISTQHVHTNTPQAMIFMISPDFVFCK